MSATNEEEMAKLEAEAKAATAKLKAAKQAGKIEAQWQDAEAAAGAIPVAQDFGDLELVKARDAKIWSLNPRHILPDPVADAMLRDSMVDADGNITYDSRYPMVMTKDYEVIQGNRRLAIIQEIDPDFEIPTTIHRGDLASAMLIALQDTGTGIQQKGTGDYERAIVALMDEYRLTSHTVVAYLWRHNRELLYTISPASKNADSQRDAENKARGRLQTVEKIGRLAADVQEQIYEEHNTGIRKGKVFDTRLINELVKAKPADVAGLIEDKRNAIVADERDDVAPSRLTAKLFMDRKHVFKSKIFQDLAELFEAYDKKTFEQKGPRDAVALLMELDASIA